MSTMVMERQETDTAVNTMKAIVGERYGRPDVLELREVEPPEPTDDQVLVRVHASSVNPADWYGVTGFLFARMGNGLRRPKVAAAGSDVAGRVEAVGAGVTTPPPRRRGVRDGNRCVGGARLRPREPHRPQAAGRLVRPSRRRADRRLHRPPGAPRPRPGRARAEGADQRRVGRRRDIRRPAREGARRAGHRRLQQPERRPRALARRRPGRRLHQGGLHADRRAARPPARRRREPLRSARSSASSRRMRPSSSSAAP